MSAEVNLQLLPWQQEVLADDARFKVVVAGRRCGKSHIAAVSLLINALEGDKGVTVYVAPTQGMARDILWHKLFEIAGPLITNSNINNLEMTLEGGKRLYLKGADRPDTLRGLSINHLVLDEYAFMKADVYEAILRPALSDLKGSALFIGTPDGRNHFYDLYAGAVSGAWEGYQGWTFTTEDNPLVDKKEVQHARETLPRWAFKQEYEASFDAKGSEYFNIEDFDVVDKPPTTEGDYFIAVDLAGFQNQGPKKNKRRDSTAIAVVFVDDHGHWYVADIITGQWPPSETAGKIFKAVEKYRPVSVGIEKGLAQQAVMEPLQEVMRRERRVFAIELLTHGNQKKEDRILWALQGRAEQGLIHLKKGEWNEAFLDEAIQFPSRLAHDDMIDALAYIDQLAKTTYHHTFDIDEWEPLEAAVGY